MSKRNKTIELSVVVVRTPGASINIESIMRRKHTRKMWIDAVNKETGSLKKAGVFQFGTYKEFMKSGHIHEHR